MTSLGVVWTPCTCRASHRTGTIHTLMAWGQLLGLTWNLVSFHAVHTPHLTRSDNIPKWSSTSIDSMAFMPQELHPQHGHRHKCYQLKHASKIIVLAGAAPLFTRIFNLTLALQLPQGYILNFFSLWH